MMRKLLNIIAKTKCYASLGASLWDFAELFFHHWSNHELIVVLAALAIIPVLKFSVFFYNHFGIRIPFGLPQHHSKLVLRSVYWLTVFASAFNFLIKCIHGGDPYKMIPLGIFYMIILIMDFVETEETIRKAEDQDK